MAWIDERDVMVVLDCFERGMTALASGGDLDERGVLRLLNAALEATSLDAGGALHLRLLQMQENIETAREAYEASARPNGSEDYDDE